MAPERIAIQAGRFYPSDPHVCQQSISEMFRSVSAPAGIGAIVPHAGWVYSGATAALGIAAIASAVPGTVVIFGAVHVPDRNPASIFPRGVWQTPTGSIEVDEELASRLVESPLIVGDPSAHRFEHSIEVQLPLLRHVLPDVKIVPIMVRPGSEATDVGRFCAAAAATSGRGVAFLGSTDLTHYGPAFGFEPHGRGPEGIRWAKDVNDRRFIKLIQDLDAGGVVPEAETNRNACGAGAVAATIGAMLELRIGRYQELQHTTSAEVEGGIEPESVNSVGYEAGVFLPAA